MARQKSVAEVFTNGILRENPVLILLIGTCPTLAVSTTAFNGIGMGIAATFVLILSNFLISLIRNLVADKVRIAVYITIIAGLVTIIQLLIKAYVPALDKSLGIFIPLITVNCIILGRAEAFANKNKPLIAAVDGLGMGIGFTIALTIMASIREILGNGTIFGKAVPIISENPLAIMKMAPGGFLVYGLMIAGTMAIIRHQDDAARNKAAQLLKEKPVVVDAATCSDTGCAGCAASAGCGMGEFRKAMKPQKFIVPEAMNDEIGGQK